MRRRRRIQAGRGVVMAAVHVGLLALSGGARSSVGTSARIIFMVAVRGLAQHLGEFSCTKDCGKA